MHLIKLSITAGLVLLVGNAMAAETIKLEQESDRINYSLGHQIGVDFKRQGITLDSAALARGIEDALAGAAALLDKEDMDARLSALKGDITKDMKSTQLERVKKRKQDAERNRLEAATFLEANAKNAGVTTLANGLQYRVIKQGAGVKPQETDNVTIHYRGRKINGNEFDNTYRRNKSRTIRVADLVLGIKEAIRMMPVGSKWELFIPPDLGYGRESPLANQAVIVELELLAVDSNAASTNATNPTHDSVENTRLH